MYYLAGCQRLPVSYDNSLLNLVLLIVCAGAHAAAAGGKIWKAIKVRMISARSKLSMP